MFHLQSLASWFKLRFKFKFYFIQYEHSFLYLFILLSTKSLQDRIFYDSISFSLKLYQYWCIVFLTINSQSLSKTFKNENPLTSFNNTKTCIFAKDYSKHTHGYIFRDQSKAFWLWVGMTTKCMETKQFCIQRRTSVYEKAWMRAVFPPGQKG